MIKRIESHLASDVRTSSPNITGSVFAAAGGKGTGLRGNGAFRDNTYTVEEGGYHPNGVYDPSGVDMSLSFVSNIYANAGRVQPKSLVFNYGIKS